MKKHIKGAICAAVLAVAASGCNDFLKGGDLTKDPNNPLDASPTQFFESVQVNLWQQQSGDLARLVALWMQQAFGAARQAQGIQNFTGVTEGSYDAEFARAYGGGGILDLRKIDAQVTVLGDSMFLGISKILEAWLIGTNADIWGDIPYNQADSFLVYPKPVLDPQQQVYDSVQSKLSQGIAELETGIGKGPGTSDLVYKGDPTSWIALAHTLKARFFLHTAEVVGAQAYTSALAEATLGISSNDGDYIANFSGTQQAESNPWWQFVDGSGGTGRAGDITGLPSHLDSLLRGGDPRDSVYFATITGSDTSNADQGFFSSERLNKSFPQPFVTYNENLLIKAESQFELGQTGPALVSLNQELAAWATPPLSPTSSKSWHPAVILPAAGSISLGAIMNEKNITLFQNIEVWNDYKRTCYPQITPFAGGVNGVIPGRLLYPVGERQTNSNVPLPSQQPARNHNDPNPCP